jgi:hypothetical protein
MTDEPAAVKATFSDFRLIKGRKQAQLVLEIPIEEVPWPLLAAYRNPSRITGSLGSFRR